MYPSPAVETTFSGRAKFRVLRSLSRFAPLSLALVLGACVSEPSAVTGKKQSFGYSWEQEVALGAEADKEITQEMGLYDNAQIQAYVEQIGQRVLQHSLLNDPNVPEMYRNTKFTFRVLDSPVVNAFAVPGGYVYVTRGLLSHVQNEAQLAVVLGHEIGHVAARHSSQQARRAQIGQIGLVAAAVLGQQVLGDKVGNFGDLVNMGGQALELFMMRYSREAEHESDNLGVRSAQRAGYAAAESAKFFHSLQRISAEEGRSLPTWQSTHPDPGDRASRVVELARSTPMATGTTPVVGEEEYLRRIDGIIVGNDPREGFAQNGVFYHPSLRFQFPVASGWKLDNQKAAVVMAEPNGRALMGLRLAEGARARDAAARFVQESKVQVVASSDTNVNGLPATVIVGQGNSEQGTLGVWNAFIEMEGRVFSLMGLAPAQVFTQVRPTFESITGGFGPLRNPSVLNVHPARLKVVRADRTAPLASFIPTSLPPDLKPAEVAIMNQLEINQPVQAGQLLKVPDTSPPAGAMPPGYSQPVYPYPQTGQPPPGQYPPQPYPPQPYPPQSYPPQSYPPQPGYPPQPYPPQAPGYPQTYPNYPPPASPQSQPNWPR